LQKPLEHYTSHILHEQQQTRINTFLLETNTEQQHLLLEAFKINLL